MKKLLMTTAALAFSAMLFAQRGPVDPSARAAKQTDRMKEVLSLNDAQYATVKGINEKYAQKTATIRRDSSSDFRATMQSIHAERRKEIESVLTSEQKEKWTKHQEEMRTKVKQRHTHKRGGREEMQKSLGLSNEQVGKLDEARKSFGEKTSAIKKSSASEDEKKGQFKQLWSEHDNTVKQILTAEQYAKWKEMSKKPRGKGHGHGKGKDKPADFKNHKQKK